ncbi:MAG: HAMP domain-containing protein [Anaeromyxobacter sp.]|nr:HAMP domain-containing protein [Anaeromyxobacter sp.]MBL0276290.1 HAMP domain-containing protein [Anaeromyxobacter sp.]
MTLRARLSLWFALFAALPLLVVFAPVAAVLHHTLTQDHAARLDGAARAVEGEVLRLSAAAADGVRDLAGRPEAAALAEELAAGLLGPPDAAARLAAWGEARGLDVLSLCEPDGRVVASAHLPGRAGDVDQALARLLRGPTPGRAQPLLVERAGPSELTRALAVVAAAPVGAGPLRVVGGITLGEAAATRLAAITGGAVILRDGAGATVARAAAPARADDGPWAPLGRLAGPLAGTARRVALGPASAPVATVEVSVTSAGLVRAWLVVLGAFVGLLLVAVVAAAALGRRLAGRETRALEALQVAAARLAGGDLAARVGLAAPGEVGQLVRAFDAMAGELERSRARLAASERVAAWREVARALAHELKNPLTPIAMSVELLRDARDRPDFPEILDESTRAIGEEVRRLRRIVDEFSRFARLPAPALEPVPAGELAQALLALYPADPPGVALARQVAPGLPTVLADRDQVLQVLHNLVKNALEAMPDGGVLRFSARREDQEVHFEVADSGPGIDPALLPRIFEPYVTTKEGGTGLGLAIAERIVQEHGGRLEVASRPGQGATFTIRLPVAAAG